MMQHNGNKGKQMTDKIALITGANKGIGKEIARQLGALGITVLMGARDIPRGEEAAAELKVNGADAHAITLDVTDEASISAAAAKVENDYGRLDVLVNNAGISIDPSLSSAFTLELADLRRTYETNVFGVFSVIRAFMPLLRHSEAGRIVNMSSSLGSLAENSDPSWEAASVKPLAYNSSKAALNMLTVIFAAKLKDTPIKVNTACPGSVKTDLNPYGTRTVEQGATITVYLATLPEDGPTGGYFDENGPLPW